MSSKNIKEKRKETILALMKIAVRKKTTFNLQFIKEHVSANKNQIKDAISAIIEDEPNLFYNSNKDEIVYPVVDCLPRSASMVRSIKKLYPQEGLAFIWEKVGTIFMILGDKLYENGVRDYLKSLELDTKKLQTEDYKWFFDLAISIRQSRQAISGKVSETVLEIDLFEPIFQKNFEHPKGGIDYILTCDNGEKYYVAVKSAALRERGLRELTYSKERDRSILVGFFQDPGEFISSTDEGRIIDQIISDGSYCYLPEKTFDEVIELSLELPENYKKHFRPLSRIKEDFIHLKEKGIMPEVS